MSFIFQFFSRMLSNGNKQHRKKYSTCPDLIHQKNPCPCPLVSTLWYTEIRNLHKTGKLETEKTYVLSSEILETEIPKIEKLGKIVTRKNQPFYSTLYQMVKKEFEYPDQISNIIEEKWEQ